MSTQVTAAEAAEVFSEADCLHTREAVEAALAHMASAINAELEGRDPLLLCIMNGGLVTAGKLLPRLSFPLQVDYLHATRYRGDTSGGQVEWLVKPRTPLKDRCVLLVDDILDEGRTLAAIQAYCREAGAAAVYTAVLVDKLHERKHPGARADFIGLEVEDRYVFGFGMDYKEYLRNAPGIYAVKGA